MTEDEHAYEVKKSAEWKPGSVAVGAVTLSTREQQFLDAWRLYGIEDSDPIPQYKTEDVRTPKAGRPYTWDFAWPAVRLLIEIHGFGRHNSIAGLAGDCAKMRAALAAGWMVIPITSKCLGTVESRQVVCEQIEAIINQRWPVVIA